MMTDAPEPEAVDETWRPEAWHERWIVSRVVSTSAGLKRQTLNASKFSAFCLIFEDEETANTAADRANAGEEVPRSVPQDEEA
jgi:hypothetical protein